MHTGGQFAAIRAKYDLLLKAAAGLTSRKRATGWRVATVGREPGERQGLVIPMQWVKFQVPDREECARGFLALVRCGRVDCYRDNTFVIPEPGLELLRELGVNFVELGRGGLDYAQKTLRDASAAPAQ